MFQLIKKIFLSQQVSGGKKKSKSQEKFSFAKSFDGAKQLKEMGKLGGKLILM
jgi:hypothetical protein